MIAALSGMAVGATNLWPICQRLVTGRTCTGGEGLAGEGGIGKLNHARSLGRGSNCGQITGVMRAHATRSTSPVTPIAIAQQRRLGVPVGNTACSNIVASFKARNVASKLDSQDVVSSLEAGFQLDRHWPPERSSGAVRTREMPEVKLLAFWLRHDRFGGSYTAIPCR